ncbi:hypothetical protein ABNF65_19350 [Paenibacillus larvae]
MDNIEFVPVDWHVLDDKKYLKSAHEKLVYVLLCKIAATPLRPRTPIVTHLAKEAFCSEDEVQKALNGLTELGLINVSKTINSNGESSYRYELLEVPNYFSEGYVKLADSLLTLYMRLPDFNADHVIMYAYLCASYDDDLGYASPTQTQICEDLGIGANMPGKLAKTLKKYGLIDYKQPKAGASYIYRIYPAIEEPDVFYEKYPEVPRHG